MGMFAAVRAYAIRPYIIYHLFVGDSFFVGVVPFCFSLATVGAYCIRSSCERKWNDGGEQNIIV